MKGIFKIKAFTLIEILMVISIISVITMFGFTMEQKYAQRVKVTRTANQLQQILEAGVAYYGDNRVWPAYSPDLDVNFRKYLAFDNLKNPWDLDYKYSSSGQGNKFQVTTVLPSVYLAQQVAALLPSSYCYNDCENKTVVVEALKSKVPRLDPVVLNIGTMRLDKTSAFQGSLYLASVVVDQCPSGWKQGLIVTPMRMEWGGFMGGGESHNFYAAFERQIGLYNSPDCKESSGGSGQLTCSLQIKFNSRKCLVFDDQISSGGNICPSASVEEGSMLQPLQVLEMKGSNSWFITDDSGVFEMYYINYCVPPKK